MFTGIIEELGRVKNIELQSDAFRITIEGPLVTSDLHRGDSIAVSGTCLTAIEFGNGEFTADVMKETLDKTSMSDIKVGDAVNLERAMTAETRFGGHVVQGHVDGVGEIISRSPSENWEIVRVQIPRELMKYVVLKGSITIDGISLTVNEVGDDYIALSLIPETLALTTLGSKQAGDKVNVEADVMAKHIERLLEARGI
ncbi:MAG: riboflavin synthase [Micrococcales bacterium]